MKTGIVADNYKIERFKKELNSKGFTNYEVMPFCLGVSQIHVEIKKEHLNDIKKICQRVELHFKHGN
jgi:hypothetical protein